MSFHGAMITEYFYKENFEVTLIEDSINIAPVPLKWDRLSQLKVIKTFIDFSDETKLKTVLEKSGATTVLYVPTGLIDIERMINDPVKSYQLGSLTLTHFQKLLLLISKVPSIDQFILLSTVDEVSSLNLVHKTWLSTLEQLYIHSYRNDVLKTNAALIKVNGVFGPWKETEISSNNCWYIESVAHIVAKNTMSSGFVMTDLTHKCEQNITSGVTATKLWLKNYTKIQNNKRNIVSGAVLTVKSKAEWGRPPAANDHYYLKRFLLTAMKNAPQTDIVIIHNALSHNFIRKYKDACPSCNFVYFKPVNKRIAHDQRFYMLYKYLLDNPDIDNMVTTDIRDVAFYADPFKVMKEIGDYIYTGYDIPYYSGSVKNLPWIRKMLNECYPNLKDSEKEENLNLYGIFNSGTLGASRHHLLSLLSRIILYLDTASLKGICDMVTANVVLHLHEYNHVYPGYPFTGSYLTDIRGQQGAAIWHKP